MARYGENIRKRADGRWEARYKAFDEKKCRTVYRSVYGATYMEAKEKKFAAMEALRRPSTEKMPGSGGFEAEGNLLSERADQVRFMQVAQEWLDVIAVKCKYSTCIKYRSVCKAHLEKTTGEFLLPEIGNEFFTQKISDHISEKNLSESIQKSICCVVNQILTFANRKYALSISALRLPPVKSGKKPVETLSKTEQASLFACTTSRTDRFRTAIRFCLYTGVRLGELCALKWSDVDCKGMTLTVNRTVQRIAVSGQPTKTILLESDPKSESSKRTIPVTTEILGLLDGLDKKQPYVFGGDKPLEPRTMQYRFQNILREAAVGSRHFHILRHTFATNCVESCMDVKTLSEILGHSSVKITLNRYVHPTMDSKRRQLGRLCGFYGQICGPAA